MPLVLGPKVGWSWRGPNLCWGKFWNFGISKLESLMTIYINRWTVIELVLRRQKPMLQAGRYFWRVLVDCQHQQRHISSQAVTTLKFRGGSPSLRLPVLSVAFNSFYLWTQKRNWWMEVKMQEREALPVREYLFTMTRREKQDSSVQFTKSDHSSCMLLSRNCLNETISMK